MSLQQLYEIVHTVFHVKPGSSFYVNMPADTFNWLCRDTHAAMRDFQLVPADYQTGNPLLLQVEFAGVLFRIEGSSKSLVIEPTNPR